MDIETIIESIENGEVKFDSSDLVNIVVASSTINNEHIDCDALANIIKGIQGVKKTASEDWKEFKKEAKKSESEVIAKEIKDWFDTLEVGSIVSWKSNKGIITGTKAEQKKDAKKAHVMLVELPVNSKSSKLDRHIKFENIIKS